MKKKTEKAHLVESDEPIHSFGGPVETVCIREIKRPSVLFMWDDLADGGEWLAHAEKLPNVCGDCVREKSASRGYVYGVIETLTTDSAA